MFVTPLLIALAASANARERPARLPRAEVKPVDVGFTLKKDAWCISPSGGQAGDFVVAENCTESAQFPGWNLGGSAIEKGHHLRVANTTLCLSAGTDWAQWDNGLALTLEECVYATANETWRNTQVWRKDIANGPGSYRLMDQETLSPYDYYSSEWCMDVRDGWTPNDDSSASTTNTKPNPNQVFTDNWKSGPGA
ncbi:hypothetical protein CC85DRAFT_328715 [Cutaneotrichosporon oleaginosum]|uniref:Uncharacterized protein n=1 Tax=Cutaneotrichosporon oleaginosum TaxID=879819 RepID=A0A0J0XL50_9TREE|nr:uncharacterized protein CC85DRAFT_328715 [Cutaneotrichosporon oleaginosum]KLT41863.1 hypothetical protein CC85DRAFT_328715 [Cutaneotrichosporon oleaginosum]TXT14781.1 hypothetical protein COLE_00974 [Cutaneotrichosporon oleaginosum]